MNIPPPATCLDFKQAFNKIFTLAILLYVVCICVSCDSRDGGRIRTIYFQGIAVKYPKYTNEAVGSLNLNLDDSCLAYAAFVLKNNINIKEILVIMIDDHSDDGNAREISKENNSIVLGFTTQEGFGYYLERDSKNLQWTVLGKMRGKLIFD